jgi:hypothetical protein
MDGWMDGACACASTLLLGGDLPPHEVTHHCIVLNMTMRIHKITSKESWHCVAVSFSWMKKEGGSSGSVPGFMYSVYHVTLIHPIEPSIYFPSFAILRG